MADHSTANPEATKATSTAQPPVQDVNMTAEVESERMVRAVGGGSLEVAPGMFAGALGQLGSTSQVGMLRGLQKSYGNQYVGRVIQAKLTVGQPGDVYEQEADRVADTVMQMSEPTVSRIISNSTLQPMRIQRMCTECAEEEEEKIHTKESPGQTPTVTPALEARLDGTRSGGEPLPESVRSYMEPRFGADFSGVRVHTGSEADTLNRELGAQAFTRQRDIYFGAGRYSPETKDGQWLLAHELTHVVQQSVQQIHKASDEERSPSISPLSTGNFQRSTAQNLNYQSIHQNTIMQSFNQVSLQRKYVEEPAAGCGLCENATLVGTQVHQVVQKGAFPASVQAEKALRESIIDKTKRDKENGRLDLARLYVSKEHPYPLVTVEIGEIKPYNTDGVKRGYKDLEYYKGSVYKRIKELYPEHLIDIGGLEDPPNPSRLPYLETQGCPDQIISVERSRDLSGLYLYSCSPPRSDLKSFKKCCKSNEDEYLVKKAELAQQVKRVGEEVVREIKRRGGRRAAASTATEVVSSSRAAKLLRVASRAALVLTVGEIAFFIANILANYIYGSIYSGTRGARLLETLKSLGVVAGKLSHESVYALELQEALSLSIVDDPDEEISTEGLRTELFDTLMQVRHTWYDAFIKLQKAANDFSAIEKRIVLKIPLSLSLVSLSLETVDSFINDGDNSANSLMIMTIELMNAVDWLTEKFDSLFDDPETIVKDDARAWLNRQR